MKTKMSKLRWCPKFGCGKKVFYVSSYSHKLKLSKGYHCLVCKGKWNREEFKKLK